MDKTTAKEGDTVTVTATHPDKMSMQLYVLSPSGQELVVGVFSKLYTTTALSTTVTLDRGPGTYIATCKQRAIGTNQIDIPITVAAGSPPDPQVTCTASPSTVYAGEAFTVTSAVTKAMNAENA